MTRIAIIAALEREIEPLVRGWKQGVLGFEDQTLRTFEHKDLVVVAGGIGCTAARHAAEAVVKHYGPEMLVSAGLAGALIRSLKVGNIIVPNVMIDAENGDEYRCSIGEGVIGGGVLVSSSDVAGAGEKQKLVERFHALAVDMEAVAVAEVARRRQIGFRCVKAISDESQFVMPPMKRFIGSHGEFQTSKFALWAAVHPMQWFRVIALARNSKKAAWSLCEWLEKRLAIDLKPATVTMLAKVEAH